MKRYAVLFAAACALAAVSPAQVGRGPGGGPPGGMGPRERPGPGFGVVGAWPAASRTPVTGLPYSAVQVVTLDRQLANGNKIHRQDETKVYRDGQGRERVEREKVVTIFDPVAGFTYSLDPSNQTATKWRVPPARQGVQPRRGGGGPGAGGQEQDLGTQTLDGIAATGKRFTHTIPAGAVGNEQPIQSVREIWTSTVLKVPVLMKTTDPRSGNFTMQLTKVMQGEPEPSLFQIPPNYTVTERGRMMGGGMMGGMPGGMRRAPGPNVPPQR